MTRYVKSSPSPWITAGRSGLISFTPHVVAVERLEAVAQEVGVEADLERARR